MKKLISSIAFAAMLATAGCATTRPHLATGPRAYWANVREQRTIHSDPTLGVVVKVWILATAVNPTEFPVVIDCRRSRTIVPPHSEQDILAFPKDKCDLQNDITYPNFKIPL
jgi:hypothetical protein